MSGRAERLLDMIHEYGKLMERRAIAPVADRAAIGVKLDAAWAEIKAAIARIAA